MQLDRAHLFYQLIKSQSYTKAAEQLNVSKAYISKHIKALEADLGTQLLVRDTRSMRLTSSGEVFYRQAEKLHQLWLDTTKQLDSDQNEIKGCVTFTAPSALAEYMVSPILRKLCVEYPHLAINCDTGNSVHNLASESFDFAIRITSNPAENMVARHLFDFNYVCCATPEFLAAYGQPEQPADLHNFPCVTLSYWQNWPFYQGDDVCNLELNGQYQFQENALIKQYLMDSLGIARLPEYMIRDELATGSLVPLFEDYQGEVRQVYLLTPPTANPSRKVELVVNHIVDSVKANLNI